LVEGLIPTSEFFQVVASNNTIVVRGIPVTFRLVTPAPGQPSNEVFCLNSGCLNGGAGVATVGGADFVAYLVPADNHFDGVYENIQTLTSGSSPGTLRLGRKFDIIDWSGAGHSFVRTGPRSIRVTTDQGAVFDVTTGPVFFEAEDMTVDPSWGVVPHFGGWYYGDPSRGAMLSGNYWAWGGGSGQGEATQTVYINEAGTNRVWVRHFYYTAYRGPFNVAVYQDDTLIGSQDFDVDADDSLTYGQFIWRSFDVPLAQGTAEIVISKIDPIDTSWVTRYVDCVVVSADLDYVPAVMDFADPLYVKVAIGPTQTTPAVIHFWGRHARPQPVDGVLHYYLPGCNIWEDGLHVYEYYTSYQYRPDDPNFLIANEESPWVNLAPLLSYIGQNHLQFYAMQEYNTGLPDSEFTLSLSTTPSDDGLITSFARAGSGSGMFVDLDLLDHDNIKNDLQYSQEARAAAAALPSVPGNRPTKFPVITGNGVSSAYCQPATVNNEIATLTALGMNGRGFEAGYDPAWYNQGFTKLCRGNFDFWRLINNDMSTPDYAAITNAVTTAAQSAISTGKVADIVAWSFMDEPGSMSMESVVTSTNCQAQFPQYLQGLGLDPAFFGASDWSEVTLTTNKSNPKLYYYTARYRCQLLTDFFKLGTTILTNIIPTAPTTANFAEEATFYGNALLRGVDWFEMFDQGALQLGWTEDWLSYTVSYQMCGYRADLLRAACRSAGRSFGMYNIISSPPWDVAAKPVTEIGHGAQAIYHYNYGPSYAGGDANSQNYSLYPALRQVDHVIGAVEDYVVGAVVPPAKVALLYSRPTDIWTMDETYSVFGKDRMGIHLLLRHLGYPVDFLTEEDVADGRLADYSMLICDGSHLEASALSPLVDWLNNGGVLYLSAGSLTYDQFNNPLGFDSQVGIARAPFVYANNPGRERYEFPALPDLKPVTFGADALESVCGYQKVTDTGGVVTVVATFDDDASPATFIKDIGTGKLVFCGFFPGLAYQKQAMIAKIARDEQNPDMVIYGSTEFPAEYRSFFSSLLSLIADTPPVPASHHLVEANRLEATNGSVIALANWTGATLTNTQVSFARGSRGGTPFSIANPLKQVAEQSGTITVTLDFATASDFIVLSQDVLPPVSVVAVTASTGEEDPSPGLFLISRPADETNTAITVEFTLDGTAMNGTDYSNLVGTVELPLGAASADVAVVPVLDNVAEGNETVTLTLSFAAGYLVGTPAAATITIADSAYGVWRLGYFGSEANDPDIGGDTGDPDRDGIPNLNEFAFNLDPTVAGLVGLPTAAIEDGFLTLTYRVNKQAAGWTLTVEVADAPSGTWNSGPSHTAAPVLADDDGLTETHKVRDLTPASASDLRLMRLRVTP
ncbi:hypothetical protein HQ590_04260, partial [bacterium]|nr:hypothetical protein [bacterium]